MVILCTLLCQDLSYKLKLLMSLVRLYLFLFLHYFYLYLIFLYKSLNFSFVFSQFSFFMFWYENYGVVTVFPQRFNVLLGKKFLFKLRITDECHSSTDQNYFVIAISDNEELFEKYNLYKQFDEVVYYFSLHTVSFNSFLTFFRFVLTGVYI